MEGGYLGMVNTFCCHDQVKMEATDALEALCQCNSPEPSADVVRQYTSTLYIPRGTSRLLYLDVSTLSGVLPPPNSLWTAYVFGSCSHTLRMRCSYLMSRGKSGITYSPRPKRSYRNAQRGAPPLQPNVLVNPLI